jgi:hypothetical protein
MLVDVVAARPVGDYRLYLRFEDGVEGEVDLGAFLSFRGVFGPLRDPAYFAQVRVDPELGTVSWPNGADLDPDVLYARLTGTAVLPPALFRGVVFAGQTRVQFEFLLRSFAVNAASAPVLLVYAAH